MATPLEEFNAIGGLGAGDPIAEFTAIGGASTPAPDKNKDGSPKTWGSFFSRLPGLVAGGTAQGVAAIPAIGWGIHKALNAPEGTGASALATGFGRGFSQVMEPANKGINAVFGAPQSRGEEYVRDIGGVLAPSGLLAVGRGALKPVARFLGGELGVAGNLANVAGVTAGNIAQDSGVGTLGSIGTAIGTNLGIRAGAGKINQGIKKELTGDREEYVRNLANQPVPGFQTTLGQAAAPGGGYLSKLQSDVATTNLDMMTRASLAQQSAAQTRAMQGVTDQFVSPHPTPQATFAEAGREQSKGIYRDLRQQSQQLFRQVQQQVPPGTTVDLEPAVRAVAGQFEPPPVTPNRTINQGLADISQSPEELRTGFAARRVLTAAAGDPNAVPPVPPTPLEVPYRTAERYQKGLGQKAFSGDKGGNVTEQGFTLSAQAYRDAINNRLTQLGMGHLIADRTRAGELWKRYKGAEKEFVGTATAPDSSIVQRMMQGAKDPANADPKLAQILERANRTNPTQAQILAQGILEKAATTPQGVRAAPGQTAENIQRFAPEIRQELSTATDTPNLSQRLQDILNAEAISKQLREQVAENPRMRTLGDLADRIKERVATRMSTPWALGQVAGAGGGMYAGAMFGPVGVAAGAVAPLAVSALRGWRMDKLGREALRNPNGRAAQYLAAADPSWRELLGLAAQVSTRQTGLLSQ